MKSPFFPFLANLRIVKKKNYSVQYPGGGVQNNDTPVYPTPWLLYPTPPSFLYHRHHPPWLGYSARKLTFGHHRRVGWLLGLWPSAITVLHCASFAAGGYIWPFGRNKSIFLLRLETAGKVLELVSGGSVINRAYPV